VSDDRRDQSVEPAAHRSRDHAADTAEGGAARTRREHFWTDRTVAWYAHALGRSDYAARVLEILGGRLAGCRDALDVGAGCGALAVPLAQRLDAVTALEPAPAMVRGLRDAVARAGLQNVRLVQARWGDAPLTAHDLVVCAHVGSLMRADSPFLREVNRVARRLVVLVRDVESAEREDKFFFSELYPVLLGRPYARRTDSDETLAGLRRLGIRPEVTIIGYRSDQPFATLGEACDFFMTYLGLDGREAREYLSRFLAERLARDGGEWVAPFRKTAAVIVWQPR
jgi:FkbM family methyltransferase